MQTNESEHAPESIRPGQDQTSVPRLFRQAGLAPRAPAAVATDRRPASPREGRVPWILVADDDPTVRDVWTTTLRQAGYRTVEARDGREALDLMKMIVPDLMILDLLMPEFTGKEVLQQLRQSAVISRIPVLIISGFLDDEAGAESGLGLNVVGRLTKPLSLTALVNAVRAGLATRPAA
jgi:DNA-binding response OmpR family regulator